MEIVDDVEIPVVDFSAYSLNKTQTPRDEDLNQIVKDIGAALKQCNAFWITNSGIDDDLVWNQSDLISYVLAL